MDINKLLALQSGKVDAFTLEELEAMTDEELLQHFAPVLHKTQPTPLPPEEKKEKKARKKKEDSVKVGDDLAAKLALIQEKLNSMEKKV